MEDFRISNYLAQQVSSYGQERAEEGAALSPDGGDGGALGDGSYHFEDEKEAARKPKPGHGVTDEGDQVNPDKKSQDDGTDTFMNGELERMRALNEPEEAESELLRQRGRHFYKRTSRSIVTELLAALEPGVNEGK